jgi:hypothetical protein
MSSTKQKALVAGEHVSTSEASQAQYRIGYKHPPLHTRFKPGQSGNPYGRPKGRLNLNTEVMRIISKKVKVRDGDTDRQMSLLAANVLAHGIKGVKGDVRSASFLFNHVYKLGLIGQEDGTAIEDATRGAPTNAIPVTPANQSRPSDHLFEGLDLNLLSRSEQLDLWQLAEIIDLGGDFTALSTADFERFKHIVNKGRGKDITPQ